MPLGHMRQTCTFEVSARPAEVAAWLSVPGNLLVANRRGSVAERSDPPVRTGSWFVLAFEQLRVRVEYTAFGPPLRVAASVVYSGRRSGGLRAAATYHLVENRRTGGTSVIVEADSSGGWVPAPVGRLLWPLLWRRFRKCLATLSG